MTPHAWWIVLTLELAALGFAGGAALRACDAAGQERRLPCAERCERWGMRRFEVQFHERSGHYSMVGQTTVCVCRNVHSED